MGTEAALNLNPERSLHVDIMRAICRDLIDLPMVLKGGTALLLCYGLTRFSEDLDFDSPRKFNIANRIDRMLSQKASKHELKIVKDTDTVQRIKSHYHGVSGDRLLKIETSFRISPDESMVTVIDGIRTYKIEAIIEQKIAALENRTTARDLYDVAFLAKNYLSAFSPPPTAKLKSLIQDLDAIEQRFEDAFEEDEILAAEDLSALVLQISESFSQAESSPKCNTDSLN
jgi:predicted nucleotidyltransferase component of viral defense system